MNNSVCVGMQHTYCYYNLVSPVDVAREREVDGDLFLWDMGEGLGFRPGVFDGVIRSVCAMNTSHS